MKKYEIVKEHGQFDEIIGTGFYRKNSLYTIYNKDNNLNISRFGIAVGKKVGNAVTRNRVKRQVRMIINNNKNIFKKGKDYIIIVKRNVLDVDFKKMNEEFINTINNMR